MDPHSTHSQFNHREPKAGPQQNRHMEIMTAARPDVDGYSKWHKSPTSSRTSRTAAALIRRPIVTNSRVKTDEKLRQDMHLAFVNNAFRQKALGISEAFDELVSQFDLKGPSSKETAPPSLTQIRRWLLAISHVVSRIERTHVALIEAIVNMPWTILDNTTVKEYTDFIGLFISARPEYLSLVLNMIARGFTYQSNHQVLPPEYASQPLTRRVVYDRLHGLLQHLLSIVPTLPTALIPILIRHFPHKRLPYEAQSTYIRNLLRVSDYCSQLGDRILSMVVDRALQIDVEIQVELEELEDQGGVDQDVFEIDAFDTVIGQEGPLDESDDPESDGDDDDSSSDLSSIGNGTEVNTELPMNIVHIHDMVKKLDIILTLIFKQFERKQVKTATRTSSDTYLSSNDLPPLPPFTPDRTDLDVSSPPRTPTSPVSQPTTASPSPNLPTSDTEPQQTREHMHLQFQTLLAIFDRMILPTFKSRYTQFLLFYYASLDPEFADVFQGMLVDRALFSHQNGVSNVDLSYGSTAGSGQQKFSTAGSVSPGSYSIVMRAAAASYIGSFVSRATFVDREGTRRIVGVLCEFLRAHLDGVEDALRVGASIQSSTQHNVFYAVAQAVFLIFCFRWRDLLLEGGFDDGESEGVQGKKWMPELGVLQRVVMCVLNPLRVCSANVVAQFAHVAQATDFIYCYAVIEANKRAENVHAREGDSRGIRRSAMFGETHNADLNSFFPFDPYRLPKSSAFINDVYREWSSVAIDDDEEDEDETEGEEDVGDGSSPNGLNDGASRDHLAISQAKMDETNSLGASLGAMSISPAHPV